MRLRHARHARLLPGVREGRGMRSTPFRLCVVASLALYAAVAALWVAERRNGAFEYQGVGIWCHDGERSLTLTHAGVVLDLPHARCRGVEKIVFLLLAEPLSRERV